MDDKQILNTARIPLAKTGNTIQFDIGGNDIQYFCSITLK